MTEHRLLEEAREIARRLTEAPAKPEPAKGLLKSEECPTPPAPHLTSSERMARVNSIQLASAWLRLSCGSAAPS